MTDQTEYDLLSRVAAEYSSTVLTGINESYHVAVRDAMIPVNAGTSALELGCGTGLWTCVLCDRYEVVDVVDGSLELLTRATLGSHKRRAKLTCHNSLVEEFSPPAGQNWQHVYLTFLLEHLSDPVTVLQKIRNWITANGSLFVAVPNASSIHRELAVRMGLLERVEALSDNDRRIGHRRVYTASLLREQLAASNYSIVSEKQIGLKPLSLGQMTDYSAPLVRALCSAGNLAGGHAAYIGVTAVPR